MRKNPTPRQISAFCALITTACMLAATIAFKYGDIAELSWPHIMVLSGVVFISSYLIVLFYLKKYIYRKVKLIYKSIHRHKLSADQKTQVVDVDTDIIDQVDKEVQEWADNQEEQITKLKTWQEYRRRFLGDISHELKTPIFNIQGYLETLLDGGIHDKKVNIRYLERAAKNVDRLNTIVEDLESISKLESGKLMLELQEFNIQTLAKEVFEDLEIKTAERNINLSFKSGAAAPFMVMADRESIRQVLINLISNSIKYGNQDGVTKVGFYDMDKYILVEVADNGIGIPSKHLSHVFDRFYRVDKSRSREQGGSGLGLAIVKHIVEAHKQTINVRSSEKMGSTFGFTLAKA